MKQVLVTDVIVQVLLTQDLVLHFQFGPTLSDPFWPDLVDNWVCNDHQSNCEHYLSLQDQLCLTLCETRLSSHSSLQDPDTRFGFAIRCKPDLVTENLTSLESWRIIWSAQLSVKLNLVSERIWQVYKRKHQIWSQRETDKSCWILQNTRLGSIQTQLCKTRFASFSLIRIWFCT